MILTSAPGKTHDEQFESAIREAAGDVVFLPSGRYELDKPLDMCGVQLVGAHMDAVTISYRGKGIALDQMLHHDRDGGRGSLEGFTLETTPETDGIRVFGDGHSLSKVRVRNARNAVTAVMPIMTKIDQVYAFECAGRGFQVLPHKGQIGTSIELSHCWAYRCGQSGFRVETVAYSKISCSASQECGIGGLGEDDPDSYGWALLGNVNGEGAHPGMTLEEIATEGDAYGMWMTNIRNLKFRGLKYVNGVYGPQSTLMRLGNVSMTMDTVRLQEARGKLRHHIGFLPDPSNPNWIWDSNGRKGSIFCLNSRFSVEPFKGEELTENELSRFTLVGSEVE